MGKTYITRSQLLTGLSSSRALLISSLGENGIGLQDDDAASKAIADQNVAYIREQLGRLDPQQRSGTIAGASLAVSTLISSVRSMAENLDTGSLTDTEMQIINGFQVALVVSTIRFFSALEAAL
jgi:hypothetical protein